MSKKLKLVLLTQGVAASLLMAGCTGDEEPQQIETMEDIQDENTELGDIEENTEDEKVVYHEFMTEIGIVQEIIEKEDGDVDLVITPEDATSEDDIIVLQQAAEDMTIGDIQVGDMVIAATDAGTPQTMQLPVHFRYKAITKYDPDASYRVEIFDEDGVNERGDFRIVSEEDTELPFAGNAVILKYNTSTDEDTNEVDLKDVEITEFKGHLVGEDSEIKEDLEDIKDDVEDAYDDIKMEAEIRTHEIEDDAKEKVKEIKDDMKMNN